ncbi:Ig-like domain-containing protein [Rhizorhabdus wittichii]
MADFIGTSGPDNLVGEATADLLQGLDGDDTLNGGGGVDALEGGAGDDLLIVADIPEDGEAFNGGDGTDTLQVDRSATFLNDGARVASFAGSALNSIDRIAFGSQAGDAFQVIVGSYQVGGGVSPTAELIGGAGDDILIVLAATPGTYTLSGFAKSGWNDSDDAQEPGDVVALVAGGGGNYTLNASAGHTGVEALVGAEGADVLNGSDGIEILIGGGGADTINAGGGDDLVEIDEPIANGARINGGDGIDTIEIGIGAGTSVANAVQVNLIGITLNSIERLVLDSDENVGLRTIVSVGQIGAGLSSTATLNGGDGDDSLIVVALTAGNYTLAPFVRGSDWDSSSNLFDPGDTVTLVASGAGNFTLNASAGHAGIEALVGSTGNDTLNGTDGAEILNGGGGLNFLNGGGGDDKLVATNADGTNFTFLGSQFNGGDGFDWLSIGGAVDFQGNLDSIEGIDLQPTTDGSGDDASLTISTSILNDLPANLTIRGDGEINVTVEAGDGFDGSAFIIDEDAGIEFNIDGSNQGDVLTGTADEDEIEGNDGDDTLNGGAGQDELEGGAGNDVLIVADSVVAGEIFNGGDGIDTLLVRTSSGNVTNGPAGTIYQTGLIGTATLTSIEKLAFGSTAEQNQSIIVGLGQLPGNATLVGGAGNDALIVVASGGGTFTLPGFARENWNSSTDTTAPGDTVTLVATGNANYMLNASAGHVGIEALVGGLGNDTLNGTDGVEILNGGGGINILNAGGGNDRLGAINNFQFGAGPTSFTFAGSQFNGGDGVDYLAIGGHVNFQGNLDSIEGIELLPGYVPSGPGTAGQEEATLEISTSILNDLPSNLSIRGTGDIDINVEAGDDFDGSAYMFEAGSDVDVEIFGSDEADEIIGTSQDDELAGGDGNDTLDGGAGRDELYGEAGDDLLVVAAPVVSGEVFNGGDGIDTLLVQTSSGNVTNGPAGTIYQTGFIGNATLTSIDKLAFGSEAGESQSVIVGLGQLPGNATLVGGAGNDALIVVASGGGTFSLPGFARENWNSSTDLLAPGDTVTLVGAGSANYTLNASAGHAGIEALVGGTGNDTLNGTDGVEILNGGGGVNILNAGGGNDRLVASNSLPFGASGPTSFTFAGSQFNGGDGVDYLGIGGYVKFEGNVDSIEGIELLPGYAPSGPGSAGQEEATLEISTAHLEGFADGVSIRGTGDIDIIIEAGDDFDGSGVVFESGSNIDVEIFGSDEGDVIIGTSQDDEVAGGAGDDVIDGGAGNDLIEGGDGIDTVVFAGEKAGYSVSAGPDGAVVIDGDTISEVEIFRFTDGDFRWNGTALVAIEPGTLTGTSGNDTIIGTPGADIINGKGGIDNIQAGGGDDRVILDAAVANGGNYNGGDGFDTLELNTLAGAPRGPNGPTTIYAGQGYGGFERVEFHSNAGTVLTLGTGYHVVNSNGTFTIPAPGHVVGGAGSDNLVLAAIGGMGTDTNIVMPTIDAVNWTTPSLAYKPGDTVILSASDSASYQLTASDDNSGIRQGLIGNAGNDTLNGSSGMDLLNGNGGTNVLHGNGGNDVLVIAGGNSGEGSLFDGGDGRDFLSVGGAVDFRGTVQSIEGIYLQPAYTSAVQGSPSQGIANLTISGETIGAMASDLVLDGTGGIVVNLASNGGFDGSGYSFAAGSGIRVAVNGADGAETIIGTGQGDSISGGAGNDTLNGGGGADTIIGGDGDDVIDGGQGTDIARFAGNRADYAVAAGSGDSFLVGGDQLSNIEVVSFADGDYSWNGSDLVGANQGTIADGYISGATVYIDVNGNGQLDGGEDSTTSDANGNYTLVTSQIGSLRAFGGTNIDTNLPNQLTFAAPSGSTVINPLTTLVETLVSGGASVGDAEVQVKQAFGIDAGVELLKLDLVGASTTDTNGLIAQKAAVAVAELLNSVAGNDGDTAMALGTLSTLVAAGNPVDLTSQEVLTNVIGAALSGATPEQVAAIVEQTQATTQAIAEAESVTGITAVQANNPPVATADTASVNEDATVTGNLLTNDTTGESDPEATDILALISVAGQPVTDATVVQGQYGTLTIDADGSWSYVADGDRVDARPAGETLTDSFAYTVGDGRGGSAGATLTISVATIDDVVTTSLTPGQTTFTGTAADDRITGNSGANSIRGGGGADVIDGGAGDDSLGGGAGDDSLVGGNGHDWLYGGYMTSGDGEGGNDTLSGGAGNDHIYGNSLNGSDNAADGDDLIDAGDGTDVVIGNGGNDTISGGAERDRLYGSEGNDSISGGTGNDHLNGNQGNDVLSGGDGDDLVRGGKGNDRLSGDAGNDTLLGDLGDDTLVAGNGVDELTGGAGADLFDFASAGAGNLDTAGSWTAITDFEQGIDRIRLGFTVSSGEVLHDATNYASVSAAQVAAVTLLSGHGGTQDVAALQVGTDTYLFYNAAGAADQVNAVVALRNTTAADIDQLDFAA